MQLDTVKNNREFLGIVIALPSEARPVLGRGGWETIEGRLCRRSRPGSKPQYLCVCSGTGQEKAFSASAWLISNGAVTLLSMGLSGGLRPDMKSGDIIVSETILEYRKNRIANTWEPDRKSAGKQAAILTDCGIHVYSGPTLTTDHPVLSPGDKKRIHKETMALACDMETAAVSMAASVSGIPFHAVRTVCDPADRTLPPGIVDCLRPDGSVSLKRLLVGLMLKPPMMFDLYRIYSDYRSAIRSLGRAWSSLSTRFF